MDYLKEFQSNLEYHFSEILEYPLAKPYWIYISLSHKCTYSCQMCGVVKILRGYELPAVTVKKSLDEIFRWGRDCVVLFTGGEPFLRKDIFEIIGYSIKRGLRTEVVSNGALINEPLAYKIVSSGLQNIAISLDGAKKNTHESIREEGSFKKAVEAIKILVETKRKLGAGPQISVWTTIMKENVKELHDIIFFVKDLGVECLVYHPVIVAQDDMQNTSPSAPFWIRGEDLEILKDQIDKIVEYRDRYGLVAFLHDPYLWVKYFQGDLDKNAWKCNPFIFINIGPDGEVRSCGSAFGNIGAMGLTEVLYTEEADQARKLMKTCQKPCLQTCWAHPGSDSLLGITENFIGNIKDNKNKTKLLKEALDILEDFEDRLRSYQHA